MWRDIPVLPGDWGPGRNIPAMFCGGVLTVGLHWDVQSSLGNIQAGVQSVATTSLTMGTALMVVQWVLTVVLWLFRSVIRGPGWESCYHAHHYVSMCYSSAILCESTLGDFIKMFNNWFSLGMTVVTGTLLQSKSWFIPDWLTDWRTDWRLEENYSLWMTGGEMLRLIFITGMNQLPSSGPLKREILNETSVVYESTRG